MQLDRVPEARRDIVESIRRGGQNMTPLLDLVVRNRAEGNRTEARKLLRVARALTNRMDTVQRERLEAMTESMDAAP